MFQRSSVRAPPEPGHSHRGLGISAMVLGTVCAALQAAFSKQLTADLPVPLIVWWRFFGIFVIVLPFALMRHPRLLVLPPRPLVQITRGVLLVVASVSFVFATSHIALADAISIAYVYPFAATLLAAWFLHESVPRITWLAVGCGFLGVLVVMRPGIDGLSIHALLALVAGLSFSVVLLLSRLLAGPSPTFVTSTWTAGTGMLIMAVALPSLWTTPNPAQFFILALIGVTAALSQLLVVYACSKAPMSTLAPFGYVEIPIATFIGVLMFSDFPDIIAWLGICLIITGGLMVAMIPAKTGSDTDADKQA